MDKYTGYKEVTMTSDEMADFYSGVWRPQEEFKFNEFLLVKSQEGEIVDKRIWKGNEFKPFPYPVVNNGFMDTIKPRNAHQECAMAMLRDEDIPVKLITGTYGSGKTLLLTAVAYDLVRRGKFDKIIWVRNNVQVKDTDQIGALPGDELDKMLPYVMPLADHCGGVEGVKLLLEQGQLEVIPLGFLRGRSLRKSIIISSEAENLTKEHIQLMLGRIDEGSNLCMDADLRQRDRIAFEKSKGIETMIERLSGDPLFGYVHLVKTERSKAAQLADKLD